MICPYCRKEISEGLNVCPGCGSTINLTNNELKQEQISNEVVTEPVNNYYQNNNTVESNTGVKSSSNFIKIFVVIAILGALGFFAYKSINKNDTNVNNNQKSNNAVVNDNKKDETENVTNSSNFKTTFKNYKISMTLNTKISGIEVSSVSEGVIDEQHQKEYLDIKTTTLGLTVSNKAYYDYSTGYMYMTQPYADSVWYKQKGATQTINLDDILNSLISMKNTTKIDENHYKVKMTEDDIKGLMDSANAATTTINGDVYVDVYVKDGYINKLEYDFSELVPSFEEFKVVVLFSDFDNAGDVEIPQSVIDNAKDM